MTILSLNLLIPNYADWCCMRVRFESTAIEIAAASLPKIMLFLGGLWGGILVFESAVGPVKLYHWVPKPLDCGFIAVGLMLAGAVLSLQRSSRAKSNQIAALQQQLRQSQQHDWAMEQFFEQSVDLLCLANFQGYFTQVNPAWIETLGYSQTTLCETPFLEFVHPEDQEMTLAEFEQLKTGQHTIHFENRYRHQKGHYLTLAWTASPQLQDQTVQAIARNITAQKQQQQEFLDALPDLMFWLDTDGHILHYKSSSQIKTYRPPIDFLGRTVAEVMPPDVGQALMVALTCAFQTQTLQTVEYQLTNKTTAHDYEARLVPYSEDRILAIVRDISNTKQIWRDRLQTEVHLQERIRQQAIVVELGQAALATASVEPLMNQICEQLSWCLAVEYVQILELLPNGRALLLRAGRGWQEGLSGSAIISAGRHSQAGYTLLSEQPVIVEDLRTERRFSGTPLLHNHRAVSGISVIIPGPEPEEQPFGVLGIHSQRERTFTQDDINFLQAVAHVLATAIARQAADERLRILERAIDTSKNGIVLTDATQFDNAVIYINPAFEAMTGYTVAEMLGQNCRILQGAETNAADLAILRDAIQEGRECSVILRNYRKDGTPFWNDLYVAPILNDQGHLTHFVGIQNDITQRYQAELALQASEEKYRRIVETAAEGIWIVDESGRTNFVNQQLAEMLKYKPEQMFGKTFFDFMDESNQVLACQELAKSRTQFPDYHDFCFRRRDGYALWVRFSISPLFEEEQRYIGALAMVTDITDRKRAEDQLEHLAFYDPLTALPNRAYFLDALYQAMRQATANRPDQFAVCFLDLDNFKMVNDGLGHEVGDKLLMAIAYRLRQSLRPQDMLARLGGDEFTVLLPSLRDRQTALETIHAMHRVFAEPFQLGDYEIVSNISIGIVFYEASYTCPEELLRDADTAMYRAKRQGKNTFAIFDQQMRQEVLDHLHLEHKLRKAIENDEFQLYYQPIVCLQSGQLCGFEALIRWHHPQHGTISPGQFIPIAEDTGLILVIGEWVLKSASLQMQRWCTQYPLAAALTINLNLSAQQFSQTSLLSQLDQYFGNSSHVPTHCFKLEITESAVMEDAQQAQRILEEFKQRGFQVAIDDFGTGYSSLSYLHRFPVDTLKIDQSFVARLETDHEDAQITSAIVTLAHNLKMNVVAEGIERIEQMQYLQTLGCEQAQGYLFAKPLTVEATTQLIAQLPATPWSECFLPENKTFRPTA